MKTANVTAMLELAEGIPMRSLHHRSETKAAQRQRFVRCRDRKILKMAEEVKKQTILKRPMTNQNAAA
ncbi:hypothetical protein [Ruegeria atlantica]|uniref:hypothetical protein n=1 Tax=Ruegeria atlantica TaxID=81569 RepID=UPI00147C5CE0|nr:hypothetical protein [Ruegeria atlantica]